MKENELKPCPFCGADGKTPEVVVDPANMWYMVLCQSCGCRTQRVHYRKRHRVSDPLHSLYVNNVDDARKIAVEKWNKRA